MRTRILCDLIRTCVLSGAILLSQFNIRASDELKLTFTSASGVDFYYPVQVSGTVTATLSDGTKSTLNSTSNKLWITKGLSSVSVSFDKPDAVTGINLDSEYSRPKLTDIAIDGFANLTTLGVSHNALTWYVTGNIPDKCTVDYGSQEPIQAQVQRDNVLDASLYNFPGWTSELLYYTTSSPVSADYFTYSSSGEFHVMQNITDRLKLRVSHTSGVKLESQGLLFNKRLFPFISFTTDGRGNATTLTFQSNQPATQTMIGECKEAYVENDIWKIVLNVPSVLNKAETITVSSNLPEVITYLDLRDLGINAMELMAHLPALKEVHLEGNSLLPSAIPSVLKGCDVRLGEQNPFTLVCRQGDFTFDLSKELDAGATVEWIYPDGSPVDADSYVENNGVYTFIAEAGPVKARITMSDYPDYVISSEPIDINSSYRPVLDFSWTNKSTKPQVIVLTSDEDVTLLIEGITYPIPAGVATDIRLEKSSGSALITADKPETIAAISFAGIGLTGVNISTTTSSLRSLDFSGNNFTPFTVPDYIPVQCHVEWGNPPVVDISTLVKEDNCIDMYIYSAFSIEWFFAETEQPVPDDLYTVTTGFYDFENVGEIFAHITVSGYDGLIFTTSKVNFVSKIKNILEFESDGYPAGTLTLDGYTVIDIDGRTLPEEYNGTVNIDFVEGKVANYRSAISTYTLGVNLPENITSISLTNSGITKLQINETPVNLRHLDLSGNALTFKTFPKLDNCEVIYDNQRPIVLEIDAETGLVSFPDYSLCNDITVIDSHGVPLDSNLYELASGNDRLQFLSSVNNVTVSFAGHPDFPGVSIISEPLSYTDTSALSSIRSSLSFKIHNGCLTLAQDISGMVYTLDGRLMMKLERGESCQMEPGLYIIVLSDGQRLKVAI